MSNSLQIDQRHVEFKLEELGVPVDQIVRKTLTQCYEWCVIIERHKMKYPFGKKNFLYL